MVFLNPIRITFAGRFQADVSTVNNDVRHYDDATFVPGFQDLQTKQDHERLVEPDRLGRLPLRRVHGDGRRSMPTAPGATPTVRPARRRRRHRRGRPYSGQAGRHRPPVAARVGALGSRRAAGPPDGVELLRGRVPAATRSATCGSAAQRIAAGDGAASSTFQSVLEDVVFGGCRARAQPGAPERSGR